ncbi:MAG: hypothetical protein ACFFAU_13350 [Candidatus Hodarchaeota archaeon]
MVVHTNLYMFKEKAYEGKVVRDNTRYIMGKKNLQKKKKKAKKHFQPTLKEQAKIIKLDLPRTG